MEFGIWDLEFRIWNLIFEFEILQIAFLQKNFIFFEEKGIYLGEDIAKPIFDYLPNNGSIVDTLELLYTS